MEYPTSRISFLGMQTSPSLGESAYRENSSDSDIPRCITREGCISQFLRELDAVFLAQNSRPKLNFSSNFAPLIYPFLFVYRKRFDCYNNYSLGEGRGGGVKILVLITGMFLKLRFIFPLI